MVALEKTFYGVIITNKDPMLDTVEYVGLLAQERKKYIFLLGVPQISVESTNISKNLEHRMRYEALEEVKNNLQAASAIVYKHTACFASVEITTLPLHLALQHYSYDFPMLEYIYLKLSAMNEEDKSLLLKEIDKKPLRFPLTIIPNDKPSL